MGILKLDVSITWGFVKLSLNFKQIVLRTKKLTHVEPA